jgi:hypothetical protein
MGAEAQAILDAERWSVAADIATACSLTVAMAAVIVAVITYRREVRATADQHMHGLFKDYLLKTIDLLCLDTEALSEAQRRELTWARMTLKHHVLEEAFIWLRRRWPRRWPLLGRDRRRLDFLLGWQNALEDHLVRNDGGESIPYLIRNRGAYETDYLLFVAGVLQSERLRSLVEARRPAWRPLLRPIAREKAWPGEASVPQPKDMPI